MVSRSAYNTALSILCVYLYFADGKPIGVTQILGHYESDYEWNDGDMAMDQSVTNAAATGQRKYHSQFYKNGTECDLTGHFR